MEKTSPLAGATLKLGRRWLVFASVVIFCTLVGGGIALTRMPTWTQIDFLLDWRFSDVASISTAQLSDMLDRSRHQGAVMPLLIDVRTAQEFAVSHLPDAKHVEGKLLLDYAERELVQADRSTPIVVYCSVGVRSALAARDLQLAGFTHVQNLRGSIFQWANEGRALQGGQTVHPYSSQWGRLLHPKRRAPS